MKNVKDTQMYIHILIKMLSYIQIFFRCAHFKSTSLYFNNESVKYILFYNTKFIFTQILYH